MMSGAWMVVRGTCQPVGECMPPLMRQSNAVRMGQYGKVILCASCNATTPLAEHQTNSHTQGKYGFFLL